MTEIQHLMQKDFNNSNLNIKGFAVVECYSSTTNNLQIMKPIFVKLNAKYNQKIIHLRINLDKNPSIRNDFIVFNTPTYLIFYNGKFIDRVDGMIPFNEFAEIFEKNINSIKSDDYERV